MRRSCESYVVGFGLDVLLDLPFQVAVHDREKHLKEEVDGIYQHRQQVQPRFAGHFGSLSVRCDARDVAVRTRVGCATERRRRGGQRASGSV